MGEFVMCPPGFGAVPSVSNTNERRCPACGEYSVEKDDEGSKLVCVSCGRILEESALVSHGNASDGSTLVVADNANFNLNTSSLPEKYLLQNLGSRSRGYRDGVRRVRLVCQVLSFTPVMTEEAVKTYINLSRNKTVKVLLVYNKETVAACCAYIVARRMGWPVTKTDIAIHCQRPIKDVVHYFNMVKDLTGFEDTRLDLEEYVQSTLAHCGLLEIVLKETEEIVKLARNVWLDAGRRPVNVIIAAAYIAYHANMFPHKTLSLAKFCREFKLKPGTALSQRVSDLNVVLTRLGEELPWLTITKKNLYRHVPEILSHQKSIVHTILRRHEDLLLEDKNLCPPDSDDPTAEHSEDEIHNPQNDVSGSAASSGPNTSHRPTSISEENTEQRKRKAVDGESRVESVRSKLQKMEEDLVIYPKCYIASKKQPQKKEPPEDMTIRYDGDINSTELSTHDIPDEDLHEYIKTADELTLTVYINEKGKM